MPAKKKTTSTKKSVAKTPAKSIAARKSVATSSSTTSISWMKKDMSCVTSCGSWGTVAIVLLVLNTILVGLLATGYTVKKAMQDMEARRVGGRENYELIQQIYDLEEFKQQQRFQIEQTLQALQAPTQQGNPNALIPEEMDEETAQ
jgi:hypothetical protein